MSTPLTDAINALTASANSTTGASDTTLSAAVATLKAGYGGGGGASNIVTGTFTGTTSGAAIDVTIPYSGSGYPILAMVYPVDGIVGNSDFASTNQQYAIGAWSMQKGDMDETPTYDSDDPKNNAAVSVSFKNSASDATNYSGAGYYPINSYRNASGQDNRYNCIRFKSATSMSVYIPAAGHYGCMPNVEYKYTIVYSS